MLDALNPSCVFRAVYETTNYHADVTVLAQEGASNLTCCVLVGEERGKCQLQRHHGGRPAGRHQT